MAELQWQSVPMLERDTRVEPSVWYEVQAGGVGDRVGSSACFIAGKGVVLIGGATSDGPVDKVHLLELGMLVSAWTTLSCTQTFSCTVCRETILHSNLFTVPHDCRVLDMARAQDFSLLSREVRARSVCSTHSPRYCLCVWRSKD